MNREKLLALREDLAAAPYDTHLHADAALKRLIDALLDGPTSQPIVLTDGVQSRSVSDLALIIAVLSTLTPQEQSKALQVMQVAQTQLDNGKPLGLQVSHIVRPSNGLVEP